MLSRARAGAVSRRSSASRSTTTAASRRRSRTCSGTARTWARRRRGSVTSPSAASTTSAGAFRGRRPRGGTRSVSSPTTAQRTTAPARARRSRCASAALLIAAVVASSAGAASSKLPPLPARWPHTLQLGLSEEPGEHVPPLGLRYTYLAGGVNTGQGWSTWNPGGTFASSYVHESWVHGTIAVLTYYMLLQSKPGGGDELHADLGNLRNAQTMAAYWRDVSLLFSRVHGPKPVVVHVEPDLWGYLEQAGATSLAASFAQKWVALRNRL